MSWTKATLIALPRVAMGVLFLSASIMLFPERNDAPIAATAYQGLQGLSAYVGGPIVREWMVGSTDESAWLFEAGSWCFIIATLLDGIKPITERNMVKIMIMIVYLAAGACVAVGSFWFTEKSQRTFQEEDRGHHFFIAAGTLLLGGLCWDMGLLMYNGTKVIPAQIAAMLSLIPGSVLFLIATILVYPMYLITLRSSYLAAIPGFSPEIRFADEAAVKKGAAFYTAASVFFIIHALSYLMAVGQILTAEANGATTDGKVETVDGSVEDLKASAEDKKAPDLEA
jgi:hypothetical protein